ncbi:MAG: T9SS type A sorting domain-containing protein [Bacteroidota bacterium]
MKIKFTLTYLLLFLGLGVFAQTFTINPTNANKGQSLPVTITGVGTNFASGTNTITFVRQGSATTAITVSNLTVINNNLMAGMLSVGSNAIAAAYRVSIASTVNPTINLANGFTVNSASSTASLTAIAPNTGAQGQSLAVSITGTNTHFNSASNTVKFFSQGTESFDIYELYNTPFGSGILSSNLLISPNAPTGVYSVGVENSVDGLLMLNNSFTITANNKSLTTVTPNHAEQGTLGELSVTITGLNTQFNTGSPTFYFIRQGSPTANIEVASVTATSATSVNLKLRIHYNAPIGLYDIGYFNIDDGAVLKSDAFTIDPSTGIKEIDLKATKIYPNPASKQVTIESKQNIETITLFDVTGKEMGHKTPERETQTYELNLTDLAIPKGIYFIKVVSHDGSVTKKIIIE